MSRLSGKVSGACGFCQKREQNESTGKLYKTPDGEISAHYNCMLFSSNLVTQNTPDLNDFGGFCVEDVRREIERGQKLRCSKCKANGATVGCDTADCRRTYHYECAKKCKARLVEDEESGIYKIYCHEHKVPLNDEDYSDGAKEESTIDDDENGGLVMTVNDDGEEEKDDDSDEEYRPVSVRSKEQKSENGIKLTKSKVKRTSTEKVAAADDEDSKETFNADTSAVTPQQENDRETPGTKRKQKTNYNDSELDDDTHILLPLSPQRLEFREEGPPKKRVKFASPGTSENSNQSNFSILPTQTEQLEGSDANGQRNSVTFWRLCREANCTEIIISKIKTSFESLTQRISTETASDEEYYQVFQILLAIGCCEDAVLEAKQGNITEIQKLDEKKALLYEREKLLDALLIKKSEILDGL